MAESLSNGLSFGGDLVIIAKILSLGKSLKGADIGA